MDTFFLFLSVTPWVHLAYSTNACQFTYTDERRVGNALRRTQYQGNNSNNGPVELAFNTLIITIARLRCELFFHFPLMKVEGSTETLGLLKTLYIYFYTILTRVTFLFLNMFLSPGYRTIFKSLSLLQRLAEIHKIH